MSSHGLDLAGFDNALKLNYEGPIREQLQSKQVLLAHIRKDVSRTTFRGKQTVIPIHTGRNTGRGVRAERGTLPTAGAQSHEQAIYNMSYLYGRITLTGQTIAASKDNKGAFARAMDLEMKGLAKDLAREQNRQLWHDGSGMLSAATDLGSSTTVTVLSTKFIEVGMEIEVRTVATGDLIVGSQQTVLTVPNATTFTVGVAIDVTATAAVYLQGTRTASDWTQPLEMWGLEAIVSNDNPGAVYWNGTGWAAWDTFTTSPGASGTLGQLNADSVETWKGNVVESGAWSSALNDMQEAYDTSEIEGEVTPGLILTSHSVRRHYGAQLQDSRRYGNEVTLKSGWTGLEFGNSVIIADRDASYTRFPANDDYKVAGTFDAMYFIAPSSLEFHVLEDLAWEDTGGVLVRSGVGASGVDQFEAFMKQYANLICNRRNANTVLVGIA